MSYRPLYEDPTYDDDGQCVDEDADWEDIDPEQLGIDIPEDSSTYSPWDTINS